MFDVSGLSLLWASQRLLRELLQNHLRGSRLGYSHTLCFSSCYASTSAVDHTSRKIWIQKSSYLRHC